MKHRWMAGILAAVMLLTMVGCGDSGTLNLTAVDMMDGIRSGRVSEEADIAASGPAVTDFGLRLLQNSMKKGENELISPVSVLSALAMTMNGAEGETLAQMETVLGMNAEELNSFIHGYLEALGENEVNQLSLANSIWFKDDEKFTVEKEFLQTNGDYFDADIYKGAFDEATRKDINTWVSERTNGMIENVLDQIQEDAVMYLVNALAFEGSWLDPYNEYQVHDSVFTTEDGRQQDVELMYSTEGNYLSEENATGFIKYYKNREYAFVALLPNKGITVEEYINSLTGEKLYGLLSQPEMTTVEAALPKFRAVYDYEISDVLSGMGMEDAFDWEKADFSRLGTYEGENIFINRVIHKTYISMTETGTRAGAATVVEVAAEGAALEPKAVILNRPFVYLLVDCETNIPFFIGTMMDMG